MISPADRRKIERAATKAGWIDHIPQYIVGHEHDQAWMRIDDQGAEIKAEGVGRTWLLAARLLGVKVSQKKKGGGR